ncbi:exonuclease, DNA polymerase III, epsilon subunit family [Mycobacterium bohemicum DSM 44277]|uniref:Exonuclease, DNA polymerase III, epsilon subunit family n=1 Tax=Mycobacterium bohemicum DSM 44277 TaxID=1236609 RepID=A0A0U0W2U7_MYCBE|nr:exonuclease, DNA polymerase III, epsilon subunit family [Mycobacterium bohemicum DSM 44277]
MSVGIPNVSAMGAGGTAQLSFAYAGSPAGEAFAPDDVSLRETTFVVVDLETTGGRTKGADGVVPDAITEIGAVKVRGGAVLGEFATLVDPRRNIPPQIVQLTGITTAMVRDAPTIDAVLPMSTASSGIAPAGSVRAWLSITSASSPISAAVGTFICSATANAAIWAGWALPVMTWSIAHAA